MRNKKRHVRKLPCRSSLPMCRCLTFPSRPHVARYPKHVTKLRNSFHITNSLPTFRTIFPTRRTIKSDAPRQPLLKRCIRQKSAKNLLKPNLKITKNYSNTYNNKMSRSHDWVHRGYYMSAAALEPPARASMRALKTS